MKGIELMAVRDIKLKLINICIDWEILRTGFRGIINLGRDPWPKFRIFTASGRKFYICHDEPYQQYVMEKPD